MKKIKEKKENINSTQMVYLDFIAKGLSCHALCLVKYAGVLDVLTNNGEFHVKHLQKYKNPNLIRAALSTLVGAKILTLLNNTYCLTDLGKNLTDNIGAIILPFVGYRNLIAKQLDLLNNPSDWNESEIDYSAIALSSIEFGLHDLDPIILEIFQAIGPRGTVCDLGCGTGEKLVKICKELGCTGLGIEKDSRVIKESREFTKNCSQVEIIQGDITNLDGVWEDVDVAMISMVYHDISPSEKCIEFLSSLHKHFPRLQRLLIVDIVSMSETIPTVMPGFDYVHGLQGITPRSYEETLKTFADTNFAVLEEVSVPNMPNMFIWMLKPKRQGFIL